MVIFYSTFFSLTIVLVSFILAGIIVYHIETPNSVCREVYKSLPNRTFTRNANQIYSHAYGDVDDGFVWFTNDNSFCLKDGAYLHDASYLSPVHVYWLRRYRMWFKKNVDISLIKEY